MTAPVITTATVRAGWVLYAVQTLGWTWAEAKESFDAWRAADQEVGGRDDL